MGVGTGVLTSEPWLGSDDPAGVGIPLVGWVPGPVVSGPLPSVVDPAVGLSCAPLVVVMQHVCDAGGLDGGCEVVPPQWLHTDGGVLEDGRAVDL